MSSASIPGSDSFRQFAIRNANTALMLVGVTLLVSLVSLLPTVATAWEFDRNAISAGELWRIVTGHFTHWNFDHLWWDLLAFLGLTSACLRYSARETIGCIVASMMVISGVIWVGQTEILTYRGLSGIDSALFAMLALNMLVDAYRAGDRVVCCVTILAFLGLAGKVGYELLTGQTMFVDSAAAGFIPLASAHACGACVGIAIAAASNIKISKLNLPHQSSLATNRADLGRTDA